MSYDIYLKDPVTKKTIELDTNHHIIGGTYVAGDTKEAWLNITYNYADIFYKLFGEYGIRILYGLSGADSINLLEDAISKLADDVNDDYWKTTEGNVKKVLYGLLAFARLKPDGIWDGD